MSMQFSLILNILLEGYVHPRPALLVAQHLKRNKMQDVKIKTEHKAKGIQQDCLSKPHGV